MIGFWLLFSDNDSVSSYNLRTILEGSSECHISRPFICCLSRWNTNSFFIIPDKPPKCHRGGKNRGPTGTRTQGLSLSVRQLSYWANGRPLIFSPCLIRFVPESARNNGGTTKHALFDARCPNREPTLSHQMSQGRKKSWPDRDSNPGPLAIRETTELLSQWPTFDIFPLLN